MMVLFYQKMTALSKVVFRATCSTEGADNIYIHVFFVVNNPVRVTRYNVFMRSAIPVFSYFSMLMLSLNLCEM